MNIHHLYKHYAHQAFITSVQNTHEAILDPLMQSVPGLRSQISFSILHSRIVIQEGTIKPMNTTQLWYI